MSHDYFFRCLAILAIFFVIPVQANDEPFQPTNQPITIAINKTTYPYMYLNDDGKADGLMPDLWRLWAERQGIEIEFKTSDWPDGYSQIYLYGNEILLYNVPHSLSRRSFVCRLRK